MDYNIYIIVPINKLKELDIIEEKNSWLGEELSYSPQRFMYKDEIILVSANYPFKDFAPEIDNPICLKITQGIQELEWISNKSSHLEYNSIMSLLNKIVNIDSYYIYIFEDDMPINKRITMNPSMNLEKIVKQIFNWENPDNILIYRE